MCASGCAQRASNRATSIPSNSPLSSPPSSSAGRPSCARPARRQIEGLAMLTQEQNEQLVRTDAGTLMGDLFRRYWIPALHAWEIAEPDCAPVRVQIMGEKLVAFRDSKGQIGVIDEFCAHRGVSLWFGRNEECGLRCPYHGWKYDVTGQCVDLPSEPEMAARIKLKSYPAIEKGGVVWVYMGPPELKPALPELEWTRVAPERRFVSKRIQESNYL